MKVSDERGTETQMHTETQTVAALRCDECVREERRGEEEN